jgi:putative hemolysin
MLLHVLPQPVPASAQLVNLVVGDYLVRLAVSPDDVLAAQELRYRVFRGELGEGLPGADELRRDEDHFDSQFDHLLLCDRNSGECVGTYRLQTANSAKNGAGFYCDGEFQLAELPQTLLEQGIELGRACIAKEHRRSAALLALWRGLAAYLLHHGKRYLFGCCSLTGVDPQLARVAARWLELHGYQHGALRCGIRPGLGIDAGQVAESELAAFRLPHLFGTYLRYGAKVCGGPALDREFGTTDFLIVLDVAELTPRQRSMFF